MLLHTWGQKLDLHIHVHCIVTGGGLTQREALGQFEPLAPKKPPESVDEFILRVDPAVSPLPQG